MLRGLLVLAALSKAVFSFQDTYPILAWSSHSSPVLDRLSNALAPSSRYDNPLDVIYESTEDLCSFDAVVFVEHDDLQSSDLRASSNSFPLLQQFKKSDYSTHYPYVRNSAHSSTQSLVDHVSRRCGSHTLLLKDGASRPNFKDLEKLVVKISALDKNSGDLSGHISSLEEAFTRHLFIISGVPTSHLYGRAVDGAEEDTPFSHFAQQTRAPQATGGILKRYQLLTPALIISLLVVFFVIVPILYIGISALASVQNSIRLDAPKIVSQDRKNQ